MAEILVENQICGACGAEVRKGALFCYNCGKSVAPAVSPADDNHKIENRAETVFKERVSESPGPRPKGAEIFTGNSIEKPDGKPTDLPENNLKSAASMRRKAKTIQRKRVEVVWEEHGNAPNIWFILVALLLTLFAAGIWYLAIVLR